MESVTDRLNKLREERIAREKARIEKLRELNLKKYSKEEPFKNSMSNPTANKSVKSEVNLKAKNTGAAKNNFHVSGTTKRPITVPALKPLNKALTKPKTGANLTKTVGKSLSSNILKAPVSNFTKKFDIRPANVHHDKHLYAPSTDEKFEDYSEEVTHVSHEKKQNFAIRADSMTTNLKGRQSVAVANNKKFKDNNKEVTHVSHEKKQNFAGSDSVKKMFDIRPANVHHDKHLYAPSTDEKLEDYDEEVTHVSHEKKQNFAIRADSMTTNLKGRQSVAVANNKKFKDNNKEVTHVSHEKKQNFAGSDSVKKMFDIRPANVHHDKHLYAPSTDEKLEDYDEEVTHVSHEKKQNFAIRADSMATNLKGRQSLAIPNNKKFKDNDKVTHVSHEKKQNFARSDSVKKMFDIRPANVHHDKHLYAPSTDEKFEDYDEEVTHVSHEKKQNFAIRADSMTTNLKVRQSLAVANNKPELKLARKSMIPQSASTSQCGPSVFERLYKPKTVSTTQITDVEKLHNDPNYLKKVIRNSGIILNKRHTVFENPKPKIAVPVRRSISAVHFKRIGKQELGNCIHKWSSIGDKLNNVHLKNVDEDENIKEDKVVSAVKSERKKVTFMTPMGNFNTPTPEELQGRLKAWLQKRGKSLDSYHHLQCFGIHHLPHSIKFDKKLFDEENKENIAVESDSDDDSYAENMNEEVQSMDKWRTASCVSDSVGFNESQDNDTTITSSVVLTNLDEVVVGALKDLTDLLREGFDWEQCARWLRAIRERFPCVPNSAEYWECRAALEDRRGDLPASVQCWEEAIAKGTEHSVVEANLDQLLDKFMQLKISPNSGKRRQVDPKLVDVKNVFKSTIIRFAVQQAKLYEEVSEYWKTFKEMIWRSYNKETIDLICPLAHGEM